MKNLTLDDLKQFKEGHDDAAIDLIIGRMIIYWERGHKDIALDVINCDYDKVRSIKPIANFFKQFEETYKLF